MKNYQKALIIIKEEATAKSKHNKLIKLIVATEEVEFKERLEKLAKAYSYWIKPRWSRSLTDEQKELGIPSNNREWKKYIAPIKNEVQQFIEDRIDSKKPEWQITAEKNGWESNQFQKYWDAMVAVVGKDTAYEIIEQLPDEE